MNSNIQLALWIAHPVLELFLIGAMLWRRLHRTFPVFFAYVIFQVLNFLVLFPIYKFGSTTAYFYAYWISMAVSLAIGFKVIHEVFLDVFRPYHTLKDMGTVLFKWAALVMLLVAVVVTASNQGSLDSPLVQAVIIGQRCVRVMQCGLILFLLVFSGGEIRPHMLSLINTTAYSFAIFVWIGYASWKTIPRDAPANMRMSHRWE